VRAHGLALSLVLVLGGAGGCKGGSGTKVLYVMGPGSPTVAILEVSGAGALIPTANFASTGSAPDVIGIDPLLRFAYVVDSANGIGAGAVSQYVLNRSTGILTAATFSSTSGTASASTPVPTGVNPSALAIDGNGFFVYVANQGSNSISGFLIDQVGGTLTEIKQQPPTTPNCVPNQIIPCPLPLVPPSVAPKALTATASMLFVAMTDSTTGTGSIATYMFNTSGESSTTVVAACPAGPGCLQSPPASTIAAGTNPVAMTMDPSGKFLFVVDSVANTVAAFSIASSGQLTAVGAPLAAGTTPVSVRVNPKGNFLYIANQGSGTNCVNGGVSAFSFDSSGALTALSGSPFTAGTCPSYLAPDSSGSFLFVANSGSNTISVFSIDSSGALAQVSGSPFNSPINNPTTLASIN